MFVAHILSALFTYQTQKEDDTSLVALPATLSGHVLSTGFEMSQ